MVYRKPCKPLYTRLVIRLANPTEPSVVASQCVPSHTYPNNNKINLTKKRSFFLGGRKIYKTNYKYKCMY